MGSSVLTWPITSSTASLPVIAATLGWRSRIFSGRSPRQPVTMTLPVASSASPMAASDSSTAGVMKPQVFTMTAWASS